MIAINNDEESKKMHKDFMNWKDKDVYAYVKSQDNRWLFEQDKKLKINLTMQNNTANIRHLQL